MLIRVRQATGFKDRCTLLPQSFIPELRAYWLGCQPKKWLFSGARPGRHLTDECAGSLLTGDGDNPTICGLIGYGFDSQIVLTWM